MKNKNYVNYNKFIIYNKLFRESPLAPNAFSKFENKGAFAKILTYGGEKLIEQPIYHTTYNAVGVVYNKKKHTPYVGSILYTIFKWMLLFILSICPPLLFVMLITGICNKLIRNVG